MKNIINKKGFTLIELLVVVVIIGILATIVMVNLNGAQERSRDAQRKKDITLIASALDLYYVDNKSYPSDKVIGVYDEISIFIKQNSSFGKYLTAVPSDPNGVSEYQVRTNYSKTNGYKVIATKPESMKNASGSCDTAVNKRVAGDYCDPSNITRFQVSSSIEIANKW